MADSLSFCFIASSTSSLVIQTACWFTAVALLHLPCLSGGFGNVNISLGTADLSLVDLHSDEVETFEAN